MQPSAWVRANIFGILWPNLSIITLLTREISTVETEAMVLIQILSFSETATLTDHFRCPDTLLGH